MTHMTVEVPDAEALDLVKQTRNLSPGNAVGSRVVDITTIPATMNTTTKYRVTVELAYDFTPVEMDPLIRT